VGDCRLLVDCRSAEVRVLSSLTWAFASLAVTSAPAPPVSFSVLAVGGGPAAGVVVFTG